MDLDYGLMSLLLMVLLVSLNSTGSDWATWLGRSAARIRGIEFETSLYSVRTLLLYLHYGVSGLITHDEIPMRLGEMD